MFIFSAGNSFAIRVVIINKSPLMYVSSENSISIPKDTLPIRYLPQFKSFACPTFNYILPYALF